MTSILGGATARTTLPASDLDRAGKFYSDILGLKQVQAMPVGLVYETGSAETGETIPGWGGPSTILLYLSANDAREGHMQVGFRVTDIAATVAALKQKGVVFEEYDSPDRKTVDGIATVRGGEARAAQFTDSEGNKIGLIQFEGGA